MRVCCYSTWADLPVQEQLWLAVRDHGWISAGPVEGVNYYYIPETLVSWCLLIDPSLRACPSCDWFV